MIDLLIIFIFFPCSGRAAGFVGWQEAATHAGPVKCACSRMHFCAQENDTTQNETKQRQRHKNVQNGRGRRLCLALTLPPPPPLKSKTPLRCHAYSVGL